MKDERMLTDEEYRNLTKPLACVTPDMAYVIADTNGVAVAWADYIDLACQFADTLNRKDDKRGFVVIDNTAGLLL